MSAAPLKATGRTGGSSGTEMFVKVTGTVKNRDTFEIKTVRYRIGAVSTSRAQASGSPT